MRNIYFCILFFLGSSVASAQSKNEGTLICSGVNEFYTGSTLIQKIDDIQINVSYDLKKEYIEIQPWDNYSTAAILTSQLYDFSVNSVGTIEAKFQAPDASFRYRVGLLRSVNKMIVFVSNRGMRSEFKGSCRDK